MNLRTILFPLAMAAGLACMEQMTPEAYDRLNGLGERLRDGLRAALRDTGPDCASAAPAAGADSTAVPASAAKVLHLSWLMISSLRCMGRSLAW